jgi:hypothetical protein
MALRSIAPFTLAAALLLPAGTGHAAPPRPTNLDAFFEQRFVEIACPPGAPDGFCLQATGTGFSIGLGRVTFVRTVIIGGDFADGCVPATTSGTLTTRGGDTLSFAGAGSFCIDGGTAAYAFTATGGTGRLAGMTGNGTITVPPAKSDSTGTEIWTGFLAGQ